MEAIEKYSIVVDKIEFISQLYSDFIHIKATKNDNVHHNERIIWNNQIMKIRYVEHGVNSCGYSRKLHYPYKFVVINGFETDIQGDLDYDTMRLVINTYARYWYGDKTLKGDLANVRLSDLIVDKKLYYSLFNISPTKTISINLIP